MAKKPQKASPKKTGNGGGKGGYECALCAEVAVGTTALSEQEAAGMADAAGPVRVGVGIGGDFELCCILSKKALLRTLGTRNSDSFYAQLERDLLEKINRLGLGPAGLGGDTTALDCMIEFAPCHIASLPVAVNIECHSHRHKSCIL